jgi:hypothetical protein
MLKKLFFTAAAAAAVSVRLAGVARATPSDNNPPGQPLNLLASAGSLKLELVCVP